MWWVYILQNDTSEKFYTGYTADITRRIFEHNCKKAHPWASRQQGIWKLTYKESFESKTAAISREKEIKKHKSRVYIESLISSEHQKNYGVVD
jgi:putative endonuclease